jgi:hypothetical protein
MSGNEDIVVRALVLISPNPAPQALCATTISVRVDLLRQTHQDLSAIPSPGDLKKGLETVGRDLERTRQSLQSVASVVFEKDVARQQRFFDELDWLIDSALFHHAALGVPRGSRRWDNMKALAARFAAELLRTYSASPPTKTIDGVYFQLAALIYEGVTGAVGIDLSQYCRDVIDSADEPGGGRLEPSIVVRAPFAE